MSAPTLTAQLAAAASSEGATGTGGLRFLDRRLEERWLGWGELHHRARQVAAGLAALGVQAGQRVALIYPTGEDFFAAFFGILAAGAVPVPLYPPVRLGRLGEYQERTAGMLRAAGARLVLAEGRVARLLGPAVEIARPPLGVRRLDELAEGLSGGLDGAGGPEHTATEDELALVQFSSGTTVAPKPVALSHRAVVAQTRILNAHWPPDAAGLPTGVSWLPLYHDMGLIGCVFSALALGTELTLLPPEDFVVRPALWLKALSRTRAAVSPAPNFAYALAVERIRDDELAGVDLSAWRVALNGAETVAPEVLRAFCRRFARWGFRPEALTPVYGLAEAALAVTFSSLDQPFESRRFQRRPLVEEGRAVPAEGAAREAGSREVSSPEAGSREGAGEEDQEPATEIVSVGRPLPGFELEIRGDDGAPVGEGRAGRVWIRGPSLMEGYLDQPQATAAALRDGWLDTGDRGFLSEGELYLAGRAKDLVLLRGRNYAPEEIEQALDPLPAVRTGCAVAASYLPEGADGEQLVLLVEGRRGAGRQELADLPEACRRAVLAKVGVRAEEVVVLAPGTLPRTSSGKLRRSTALERWRLGTLEAPDSVNPLTLGLAFGRSAIAYARAGGRKGHG
ncbi:MAG: fatty acyl-AMP ligase [Acidobacteriota bacterium]|nr:fatty acyl-AMP ligase [Acidobacteriota bacterium]